MFGDLPGDEWKRAQPKRAKMICPACTATGERSQLFFTDVSEKDPSPTIEFYDEHGEHHIHEPLNYTYFWCSRNHLVRKEMMSHVCEACYNANDDAIENAYEGFVLRHVTSDYEIQLCSKETLIKRKNMAFGWRMI
jgi:hypothetical protein